MEDALQAETEAVVAAALAEDLGDGDLTSLATVPEAATGRALITQKQPGVVYGLDAAELVFRSLDPEVAVERLAPEGQWREGGPVLGAAGNARALLSAERTALNLPGSPPRSAALAG